MHFRTVELRLCEFGIACSFFAYDFVLTEFCQIV